MSQAAIKQSVGLAPDRYLLNEGSLTLKNKLGITDSVELNQCELVLSAFRRQQGLPNGEYNFEHIKSMHHHLFQDVYEWAGEERECELKSPQGFSYLKSEKIERAMNSIFDELAREDYLLGMSEDQFVVKAAYYYNRMNQVHPFRTGNGRTIRSFIEALAINNGLEFDWKKITRKEWIHASIAAAKDGKRDSLAGCFKSAVQPRKLTMASEVKNEMTQTEKKTALDQSIKLVKRGIKSGKGLGAGISPDHEFGDGPGMG